MHNSQKYCIARGMDFFMHEVTISSGSEFLKPIQNCVSEMSVYLKAVYLKALLYHLPYSRNWNDFEKIYFFLPDLIHELQRKPIKPQETSDQDSDDESNSSPADSGFTLPRNIKYQRKYVCEVETKSPLCYTMKQLRHSDPKFIIPFGKLVV